jgi:hypothetical protein
MKTAWLHQFAAEKLPWPRGDDSGTAAHLSTDPAINDIQPQQEEEESWLN